MNQAERRIAPLYFESSGRIVKLLGRESIANPNVAILEMIKNAWDNDATLVEVAFCDLTSGKGKLTIRDNGTGMTLKEIRENWMVAATDAKVTSPTTERLGRPKIGEKGIARFALENLSESLTVISKPEGQSEGHRILFDWTQFEKSDAKFEKIPNECYSFSKRKDEHGLECVLTPLREKWDLDRLLNLAGDIESVLPPVIKPSHFDIRFIVPEYPQVAAVSLESKLLKKAVYVCHFELGKDGTIIREFCVGKDRISRQKSKNLSFACGPLVSRLHFFFRDMGKYEVAQKTGIYGSKLDFAIADLREFLDKWGGVKVYRDNFRVKPYGDPNTDWLGLDKLRVDDPSIYPESEQVLGFIQISRKDNPQLIDTTTREGLISNKAFRDMFSFMEEGIRFFADVRRTLKDRELGAKAVRRKRVRARPKGEMPRPPLLTLGGKYADPFYQKLEDEINEAYRYGLPNATLILSRKMVEDLVYNILRVKFEENRAEMWWDKGIDRALGLGALIHNLATARKEFKYDQPQLIGKFLELVNPFLREAGKKAHYITEYLANIEELEKLRIPEIINLLLDLRSRIKRS